MPYTNSFEGGGKSQLPPHSRHAPSIIYSVSPYLIISLADFHNHALQGLAGTTFGEVGSSISHHVVDLFGP